jgi:aspartyl/asparaginyl beta-hydroxylase (cupin superfamily)
MHLALFSDRVACSLGRFLAGHTMRSFLRYHLGLIVPHNNTKQDCYLRIRNDIEKNTSLWLYEREELLANGTHYYWHEGEGVMFDDNPLHDATNESDEVRVVLFLDVARNLPWYLDIVNRIAIFVANRQGQIVNMRKRAILDEGHELSIG